MTDKKKIEMRVLNNQDIFNRGYKFEKVKIDENFPKYILDNKSKFSDGSYKLVRPEGFEPSTF